MRSLLFTILLSGTAFAQTPHRVKSLEVQVLSTMLASNRGIGEWGFAAIVDVDGHRILFDTGARPTTVRENARELRVDLSNVPDVILSHNHADHTGGLTTLRAANPTALGRAHIATGIFLNRRTSATDTRTNPVLETRKAYEQSGGKFIEYGEPKEIFPGVWLTGPVPRTYPEKNYGGGQMQMPDGWKEDTVPEDQSLVIDTEQGLVIVSGCGHSGIVNTLEYARKRIRQAPVHAALGGFHLFGLDDEKLSWTAGKLREFNLANFLGVHCTGIEAVYRLREGTGLNRKTCVVGTVGATFRLGKGLDAGALAR